MSMLIYCCDQSTRKQKRNARAKGRERENRMSVPSYRATNTLPLAKQANHVDCSAHLLHFTWNWFQLHDTWFAELPNWHRVKISQNDIWLPEHIGLSYMCEHVRYSIFYLIELNGIKLILSCFRLDIVIYGDTRFSQHNHSILLDLLGNFYESNFER